MLASLLALAAAAATQPDPPSPATIARNRAAAAEIAAMNREDETLAARGFMGTRRDPLIRGANGEVVADLDAFGAVQGAAPASVNPSLWRHARLLARHGLFRVTDDIYQVRGFDLANITFVRGRTGWIVIDTPCTARTLS